MNQRETIGAIWAKSAVAAGMHKQPTGMTTEEKLAFACRVIDDIHALASKSISRWRKIN